MRITSINVFCRGDHSVGIGDESAVIQADGGWLIDTDDLDDVENGLEIIREAIAKAFYTMWGEERGMGVLFDFEVRARDAMHPDDREFPPPSSHFGELGRILQLGGDRERRDELIQRLTRSLVAGYSTPDRADFIKLWDGLRALVLTLDDHEEGAERHATEQDGDAGTAEGEAPPDRTRQG